MRNPERIPIVLKHINWEKAVETYNIPKDKVDFYVRMIKKSLDEGELQEFWSECPDLRLSQVLVAMHIIPNTPGFWFYKEDIELLLEQGVEPRECLLWGNNYDKDMKLLPETKWVLVKDLATDHIETLLKGKWTHNEVYIDAFKKELKLRKSR